MSHSVTMGLIALAAASAFGKVIYVDISRTATTGCGTGSWENACKEIGNVITLQQEGDQIWVAAGTYIPPAGESDGFPIRNGVTIYGGFSPANNVRDLASRNPILYSSIFSGDVQGNDPGSFDEWRTAAAASNLDSRFSDNRENIVTSDGLILSEGQGQETGLDGITIKSAAGGNGVSILGRCTGRFTIRNCVIRRNFSRSNGGGVWFKQGDLLIENSAIVENLSHQNGGGVYTNGNGSDRMAFEIRSTILHLNRAGNYGGGAYSDGVGTSLITNCTFTSNNAQSMGGGLAANANDGTELRNTAFWGNSTNPDNLGITAAQQISGYANVKLVNCASRASANDFSPNQGPSAPNTWIYQDFLALSANPSFNNISDADGADDRYFTADDGMDIPIASVLTDGGISIGAPGTDITGAARIGIPDIGAYESNGRRCYRLALTINPVGGGTIQTNPAIPHNSCYAVGSNVILTPSSNFTHWTGDASGTQSPLTLNMSTDKSLTAHFHTGTFKLVGNVTEIGVNNGIPAAVVEVILPNGTVHSGRTDPVGHYEIDGIPVSTQTYSIKVSRGCYGTHFSSISGEQPPQVTRDFGLAGSIEITTLPEHPVVNQPVFFQPKTDCPEITGYRWNLQWGLTEPPLSTVKNPVHTYTEAGQKMIELIASRGNGLPDISGLKFLSVWPCEPSKPRIDLHQLGGAENTCHFDLGQEQVGFYVKVTQDACQEAPVQEQVVWKRNGVVQPWDGMENILTLSVGQNRISADVTYSFQGQQYTETRSKTVTLTQQCGQDAEGNPVFSDRKLQVEEKLVSGNHRIVESDIVLDEDGGGVVVKLSSKVSANCWCRFRVDFVKFKHSSAAGDVEYSSSPKNDLALPQGLHKFELHVNVVDLIKGTTSPLIIRRNITVKPSDPEVTAARFSCGQPPIYDNAFWNSQVPKEELDFSVRDHTLKSSGQDFLRSMDDGRFKRELISGDFHVSTWVEPASDAQAGLMIRESESSWSPMVFLGRSASGIFISYRKTFREPARRIDLPGRETHDCVRMVREGENVTFHTRESVPDVGERMHCPDQDWQQAGLPSGQESAGKWTGLVRLGLAAAGNPDGTSTFQDLSLHGTPWYMGGCFPYQFEKPQMILNTRFTDGNLVGNWSFENRHDFFKTSSISPELQYSRELTWSNETAGEGRFYLRLQNKPAGNTLVSPRLQAQFQNDGKTSTKLYLQMQVRTNEEGLHPRIIYHYYNGYTQTQTLPDPLPTTGWWKKYEATFSRPNDGVVAFQLELIDLGKEFSGQVDFDNILLAPTFGDEQFQAISQATFADGFDRGFQTIRYAKTEDHVKATILDGQGRSERELPFYSVKQGEWWGFRDAKETPMDQFKSYYNQDDPDGRTYVGNPVDVKAPLDDFREEHGTRYFERSPLGRLHSVLGRIPTQDITYTYANDAPAGAQPGTFANHSIRTVKSDLDAEAGDFRIRQEYRDAFGDLVKIVQKGKPLDPDGKCEGQNAATNKNCEDIVTEQELDALGRTWKSVSPLGVANPAKRNAYSVQKTFNTLDEVMTTDEPSSKGATEALYDELGHLRFFKDGVKRASNTFMVNKYDAFTRLKSVHIVTDPSGTLWNQENADNPDWPGNEEWAQVMQEHVYDKAPTVLPEGLVAVSMRHLKGRVAASLEHTEKGTVSRYFSYDERGGVEKTWIKIPNLPVQTVSSHYNLGNKVVRTSFRGYAPDETATSKDEEYAYDELLRTKLIKGSNQGEPLKNLASQSYWPDGKIRHLSLGENLIHGVSYGYDVSERLIHQRHERRDNLGLPLQPSGIYEQRLRYNGQSLVDLLQYYSDAYVDRYRGVSYTYDYHQRLRRADFGRSQAGWSDDPSSAFFNATDLDGEFDYDADGALKALSYKGNPKAPYHYHADTHRLERVGDGNQSIEPGGKVRSGGGNFEYDANGNLVLDRSAKRRIEYDYRNKPIRIIQCTALAGSQCEGIQSTTEYVYDDAGNRVAKIRRN